MIGIPNRSRSVRFEMALNLGFAGARALLLVLLIRYAGIYLSATALGLFLLSRRTATTFAALLQGGMTQTLLRSISINFHDDKLRAAHLVWILLAAGLSAAIFIPLGWYFRGPLSEIMFGQGEREDILAFWTVAMTVVTSVSLLVAAYLLAIRWTALSNLVQTLGLGAASFVVLLVLRHQSTPETITSYSTWAIAAISVGTLAALAFGQRIWSEVTAALFKKAGYEFWSYGLPRGVSSFIDTLGTLVGPWLLRKDPQETGYLIIALTVLTSLQLVAGPLTQIVALMGARAIGQENHAVASQATRLVFSIALVTGALLTAVGLPWTKAAVLVWLGNAGLANGATFYLSWLMYAIVPTLIFYALRYIIEFRWTFPCNLVTLTASLAGLLAVYGVSLAFGYPARESVAAGIFALLLIQGLLTTYWVRADMPSLRYFGLPQLLAALFAIGAANYWAAGQPSLLRVGAAAVITAAGVYALLVTFRPPMIEEILAKLQRRPQAA